MNIRFSTFVFGVLWTAAINAMTVAELAKLKGQEYVDARETLIKQIDLKEYSPDDKRELVVWRAIQIRRTNSELQAGLLETERAGLGTFSGHLTAPGLWFSLVSREIKVDDERFILFSEALLFQPFKAWEQSALEKTGFCREWGQYGIDAKNIRPADRASIILEIMKQEGEPCITIVVSNIVSAHIHDASSLDLLKEIIFRADKDMVNKLAIPIFARPEDVRFIPWEETVREVIKSTVTIIKTLVVESAARKRPDVLVVLADNFQTRGLRLLDFGKRLNMPIDENLLSSFKEASVTLANETVKNAVERLKNAIKLYPSDAKNASTLV